MDDIAIQVENISKTFKIGKPHAILKVLKNLPSPKQQRTITALDGISFQVKAGEVFWNYWS